MSPVRAEQPPLRWRNWARNVSAAPVAMAAPADEAELAGVLARAARDELTVRPVGSGHSFTPLGATTGISVALHRMSGVVAADRTTGLVTLRAGTRLRDLPALLGPLGLALQNMGDIDAQTLAGAISTGTHGTGRDFTGLAGQLRGLRLMLADGSTVDCSPTERPDLFHAAAIGLGAFGVLVQVTLQCVPAFTLVADEHPEPLAEVLAGFDEMVGRADHVEFYWFPHTEVALVKANTRITGAAPAEMAPPLGRGRALLDDELLANGVFAATCLAGWLAPAVVPGVNGLAAKLVSQRTFSGDSQAVFTSPRRVRFREMEYSIDRAAAPAALAEIREVIRRRGWRISFPLEIRVAAPDGIWLSTAYQRPSAYIAVHRYYREGFADYFLAVEQIMLAHGGRPHWGKLHSLDAAALAERYPRFEEVRRLRREADPDGRFRSPYLDRVLGLD